MRLGLTYIEGVAGEIATALATDGWYAGASVMSESLTANLAARANQLVDRQLLKDAQVGRQSERHSDNRLRSDETLWLSDNPDDVAEIDALEVIDALRDQLNRQLFVGARSTELHFAHYAPGAFYRTHRDRFRHDDSRVLSLIFYLNPAWDPAFGGELLLYADDDSGREITRVLPRAGTMVCFRSERFPHEVRPAQKRRLSLTGWMRRDPPATEI